MSPHPFDESEFAFLCARQASENAIPLISLVALDVATVDRYLVEKGWTHVGDVRDVARVWQQLRDGRPVNAVRAPARRDLRDYAEAVRHVVRACAEEEERPAFDVMCDLRARQRGGEVKAS